MGVTSWGRAALGVAVLLACGAADAPPRLALVVGNAAYSGMPLLPACGASVAVVSAALKRAGFDVAERLNVSNGRMGSSITEFGDALAKVPGSVGVVYACGYAVGFDNRVFLLPSSAKIERETDALTQGVVGRLLMNSVLDAKASLVMLDVAARPGSVPAPVDTLAAAAPGRGFAAVSRTGTMPDGPTPLAAAFASVLTGPDLEVRTMLGDIRTSLGGAAGGTLLIAEPAAPAFLTAAAPPPPPAPLPASPPPAPPQPAPATPPVAAPAPATVPSGPAVLNEADMRRVQLGLQRLGYYSGRVDGRPGPDTVAAIRRFQRELGAEMTGRLTVEQAARLVADAR